MRPIIITLAAMLFLLPACTACQDCKSISLSWEPVEGAQEYEIYRQSNSGDFELAFRTENISWEDSQPTGTYNYRIRSVSDDTYSEFSALMSAIITEDNDSAAIKTGNAAIFLRIWEDDSVNSELNELLRLQRKGYDVSRQIEQEAAIRYSEMLALSERNPKRFLELKLSPDEVSELGENAQEFLEQEKVFEGYISTRTFMEWNETVLHGEDVHEYYFTDDEKTHPVFFDKDPGIVHGNAQFDGTMIGNNIVTRASTLNLHSRLNSYNKIRVHIVPVYLESDTMPDNRKLQSHFYGGKISEFYEHSSNGKVEFTWSLASPYYASDHPGTPSCPVFSYHNELKKDGTPINNLVNYVNEANLNLDNIDIIAVVVPNMCWADFSGFSDYVELAYPNSLKKKEIQIVYVELGYGRYFDKVFIHELGHSFGLPHAKFRYCDDLGCIEVEYGNEIDIMGSGEFDFGAMYKEFLGFGTAASIRQPGTYKIAKYHAQNSRWSYKIYAKDDDAPDYYVEWRDDNEVFPLSERVNKLTRISESQSILTSWDYVSFLSSNTNGLLINKVAGSRGNYYSAVADANAHWRKYVLDEGSEPFVDKNKGLIISNWETDGNFSKFDVDFFELECVYSPFSVTQDANYIGYLYADYKNLVSFALENRNQWPCKNSEYIVDITSPPFELKMLEGGKQRELELGGSEILDLEMYMPPEAKLPDEKNKKLDFKLEFEDTANMKTFSNIISIPLFNKPTVEFENLETDIMPGQKDVVLLDMAPDIDEGLILKTMQIYFSESNLFDAVKNVRLLVDGEVVDVSIPGKGNFIITTNKKITEKTRSIKIIADVKEGTESFYYKIYSIKFTGAPAIIANYEKHFSNGAIPPPAPIIN